MSKARGPYRVDPLRYKKANEALDKMADNAKELGLDYDAKSDHRLMEQPAQQEQLREENERLHVENRRLIDRIETIGVPVGVGGFATTTTAQRTWVGLTDEDYRELHLEMGPTYFYQDYGRAIEAKLKEKNT